MEVYLQHHGIKGQRWGVRRFQNEDGTLTEAGKRHKAKEYQKELNRIEWNQASRSSRHASYARSIDIHDERIKNGTKYVDVLMKRNEFAQKRMNEIEKDFNADRQKTADLLNKISRDPDLVWGTSGTRYRTKFEKGKDSKDASYYNFSTGTKYKVKSSSKERNKKITRKQNFHEYIPIREEYYY